MAAVRCGHAQHSFSPAGLAGCLVCGVDSCAIGNRTNACTSNAHPRVGHGSAYVVPSAQQTHHAGCPQVSHCSRWVVLCWHSLACCVVPWSHNQRTSQTCHTYQLGRLQECHCLTTWCLGGVRSSARISSAWQRLLSSLPCDFLQAIYRLRLTLCLPNRMVQPEGGSMSTSIGVLPITCMVSLSYGM